MTRESRMLLEDVRGPRRRYTSNLYCSAPESQHPPALLLLIPALSKPKPTSSKT